MEKVQSRISDIMHRMDALAGKAEKKNKSLNINTHQPKINIANNILPTNTIAKNNKIQFKTELERLINSESNKANVNPNLIRAIVKTESNGNQKSVSKAGAIGLMQLMPKTAKSLGVNPYNARENLKGGIQYIKNMAARYGDLDKTLAAYNAGPGNVDKYGKVPPFKETKNYIKKIRSQLIDTNG